MVGSIVLPGPQTGAYLGSLPAELKMAIVEIVEYHDLRNLRATSRDFATIITPETLVSREEMKREELFDRERFLAKLILSKHTLEAEYGDCFAVPHMSDIKDDLISVLETLNLPCYGCLKEKPVAKFQRIFYPPGPDDVRCADCLQHLCQEKKRPKCDRCGAIGTAIMCGPREIAQLLNGNQPGFLLRYVDVFSPSTPISAEGTMDDSGAILCYACEGRTFWID